MRIINFTIAILLLAATQLSIPNIANSKVSSKTIFPVVLSGKRTRIFYIYGVNPDCSSKELGTMRITSAPRKGRAQIVPEMGYSNYPASSQRYRCNTSKSNVISLYYTSREGFLGADRIVMEYFTSGGKLQRYRFKIQVK